jgi:hypothetical protein
MTSPILMNSPAARGHRALGVARSIILSRPGLIVIGLAAIGLGLTSSWGWLSAIGAAPIILAVLPCAAMCAVGACMPMMMGGAKKTDPLVIDATVNQTDPQTATPQLSAPLDGVL